MPISAGSLYDYYNPFSGTQRNIANFADLYERKKQRGMQEKELGLRERGLGLEEKRFGLAEKQEGRLGQSQGLEDEYKRMIIGRETEELKMKQDLMNDPGTRIKIMSTAMKEAFATGGKKLAESTLKAFQGNPKYEPDVRGYTIDDFQFTKGGGMYAPIITTEGERLEGQYAFVDPQGEMHTLDMREKDGSKPSSQQEYEYSKNLPEDEKAQFEKFATSGRSGDIISKSQTATIAHNIRQELRQNPYIKDFQDVDQKYTVMQKALESAKTAKSFIAVDQALITLFNKMTDPQSVVRESEYARTPQNMSLISRIKGKAEKIMSGGAGLTSEERTALTDMAAKFHEVYQSNYDNAITDYTDLAKNTGIPPELIGIPFQRKENKSKGKLTVEQAREYLKQSSGDRKKAEELAKTEGWSF